MATGQTPIDLLLFAYAALFMPALSVWNGRKLAQDPEGSLIARYLRTAARGWFTVAMVAAAWYFLRRDFAVLGLDVPVGLWGRIGLAIVAAGLIFNFIAVANIRRFISPARYPKLIEQMRRMKILPRSTREMLVFLLVAITAGVWEELLYRGFLIWFLAPYGGLVAAALLSSLIFGLGHAYQGWRGVANTFLLGLVFAGFYLATKSLWWVMAAHAAVDVYGGTLAWRLLRMPAFESAGHG